MAWRDFQLCKDFYKATKTCVLLLSSSQAQMNKHFFINNYFQRQYNGKFLLTRSDLYISPRFWPVLGSCSCGYGFMKQRNQEHNTSNENTQVSHPKNGEKLDTHFTDSIESYSGRKNNYYYINRQKLWLKWNFLCFCLQQEKAKYGKFLKEKEMSKFVWRLVV